MSTTTKITKGSTVRISETTHTPGPWLVHRSTRMTPAGAINGYNIRAKHPDISLADIVPGVTSDRIAPIAAANAALMAAAPELVAALRDLVARCDGADGVRADGSNIQTMAAHALLARIEGQLLEAVQANGVPA